MSSDHRPIRVFVTGKITKKRRATWCTTVNVCHDEVSIGVDGTLLRMTSRDVERIDKDEEMMSVALPLR